MPFPQVRLALLMAARHGEASVGLKPCCPCARDPDPRVRFTAIQWVGEAGSGSSGVKFERQLSDPKTTADLFEASLASLEMLDGVKAERQKGILRGRLRPAVGLRFTGGRRRSGHGLADRSAGSQGPDLFAGERAHPGERTAVAVRGGAHVSGSSIPRRGDD